jgi:hypothetical protein
VRLRVADAAGGVTDEAWSNAAKHYDDDQLVALVAVIALINAYNRMNVIVQPAGTTSPANSDNQRRAGWMRSTRGARAGRQSASAG